MVKASIGKRVVAYIIDSVIVAAIILVIGLGGFLASTLLGIGLTAATDSGAGMLMMFVGFIPYVLAIILALGYALLKDGLFSGRSLGKKLMGLKVTRDGVNCNMVGSILRNITLFIPILGLIELIMPFIDAEGLRFGDKIAKTKVVEA